MPKKKRKKSQAAPAEEEFSEKKEQKEQSEGDETAGSTMSFLEHLDELRVRLVRMAYGLVIGFAIAYFFKEPIYEFLTEPLKASAPQGLQLIYLDPTEAFFTYIKVAFLSAVVVTSPWIFYQLWRFIAPGLYKRERRLAWPFVLSSSVLFIGGSVFCFTMVFPFAFTFLRSFETPPPKPQTQVIEQQQEGQGGPTLLALVRAEIAKQIKDAGGEKALAKLPDKERSEYTRRIEDRVLERTLQILSGKAEAEPTGELEIKAQFTMRNYLSFTSTLLLAFGLIFETPLVLVFLGRLGVVTSTGLRKKRKYAILGMFFVAALLTPPDVVTQVLMAVPLVGLYEVSIWMVRAAEKKRKEQEEEMEREFDGAEEA